jgi:hypothetical protein
MSSSSNTNKSSTKTLSKCSSKISFNDSKKKEVLSVQKTKNLKKSISAQKLQNFKL